MSHLGNSPRTAETERRMEGWRKLHPEATTSEYNRAYTNTWNSLTEFSVKEDPYHTIDNDDSLRSTVSQPTCCTEEPKPRAPRRPKHRTSTKGAFGKKRR